MLSCPRYWNWALDAISEEAVPASPIFDPVYGFGGAKLKIHRFFAEY